MIFILGLGFLRIRVVVVGFDVGCKVWSSGCRIWLVVVGFGMVVLGRWFMAVVVLGWW
ncbi:hypothetical protein HanPSC8_Chr17g0792161 [Helianthus annuus]|nr:hypothetical protein HanPSC8_Chr17g0792161 [Helianthus annuus]